MTTYASMDTITEALNRWRTEMLPHGELLARQVADIDTALAELTAQSVHADWTQAPEWANWWAVDALGKAYWYEDKPFYEDAEWYTADSNGEWMHLKFTLADDAYHLPLGCDWRCTLQARPAAEAGAASCAYCRGTGIVGEHSDDDYARQCDVCGGTGKQPPWMDAANPAAEAGA